MMIKTRVGVFLVVASLSCDTFAQRRGGTLAQGADTPESAALKGMGAFLRGAGSYNLNTARAESIQTDTVIRWKQDLRKIAAEYRAEKERQGAGKKRHLEDVKRRLAMQEYELRVNPTSADVQNGKALNALLYDLMDPDIPSSDWNTKTVPLPKGMSVKDLIFRFTPASGATIASKVLGRGAIALSRLDVQGESWPTVMKHAAIGKERGAYEAAYARLRDELIDDKFNVATLLTLDRSLEGLKSKVQTAIPKDRGFQDEAAKFVEELKDATRMFDAVTVDYAREILVDTKNQEAATVAELVSFMLKYRLQFASAERSATGRVLYGQIYEAMQNQTNLFEIKPAEPPDAPVAHADADADGLQTATVWRGDLTEIKGRDKAVFPVTLTVVERKGLTFRARFERKDGFIREVKGTIAAGKIHWRAADVNAVKGNQGTDVAGRLNKNELTLVWERIAQDGNRASVSGTLRKK